jgi:hypothetical protein
MLGYVLALFFNRRSFMSFCLHSVSFACFLASGYALHPSRNKQMLAHIKPKKTMKDDF